MSKPDSADLAVPVPEDGAKLLDEVSAFVQRFLVLSQAQADACALWVLHVHAIWASSFTPYLHISSPVLRAGKTRLLEVLQLLVPKPWLTGRATVAVLVRKTATEQPTLLLDESDAALQSGGEYADTLRGILNTGFERDGKYSICVPRGNEWVPQDFSTFSPKAIAGIGKLPTTVEDRSIPVALKRKLRRELRERFRKRKVKPVAEMLYQRLAHWASQNVTALATAEPDLPEELNDRQQDVCEPLLAIADCAGGEWPTRARRALVELCAGSSMQDESVAVKLLDDIRSSFQSRKEDRLATQAVLADLLTIEESPWAEFQRGYPLTAQGMARLLKPFGVSPRDIRFESGTHKGYLRADFQDAWERYLPPSPPPSSGAEGQQGRQAAMHAGSNDFGERQQSVPVAVAESAESPINMRVVADVAPPGPTNGDGTRQCQVHPNARHWQRPDGSAACEVCHPRPDSNSEPEITCGHA